MPIHAQVEREQPLERLHINAGQVVDALRVADDHLAKARLFHGAQHARDAFGMHADIPLLLFFLILARGGGACKGAYSPRQAKKLPAASQAA